MGLTNKRELVNDFLAIKIPKTPIMYSNPFQSNLELFIVIGKTNIIGWNQTVHYVFNKQVTNIFEQNHEMCTKPLDCHS